jgi:hypothetical protein
MAILTIQRDWGVGPSIVRVTTSDNYATITAAGYLLAQASVVNSINFGAFQWSPTDYVLISYLGGEGFFTADTTVNNTFVAAGSQILSTSLLVTSAQFETIYTAGIQVVPTGGAHTIVVPTFVGVEYDYLTAQYTAGGAVSLQWSTAAPVNAGGTNATATVAAATINGYTASEFFTIAPATSVTTALSVNMGLWLVSATQNFATGSGSFKLTVNYRVIPTAA